MRAQVERPRFCTRLSRVESPLNTALHATELKRAFDDVALVDHETAALACEFAGVDRWKAFWSSSWCRPNPLMPGAAPGAMWVRLAPLVGADSEIRGRKPRYSPPGRATENVRAEAVVRGPPVEGRVGCRCDGLPFGAVAGANKLRRSSCGQKAARSWACWARREPRGQRPGSRRNRVVLRGKACPAQRRTPAKRAGGTR